MNALRDHRFGQAIVVALAGLMLSGLAMFVLTKITLGDQVALEAKEKSEKIEATPPKDQKYVGKNTCAACHYSKYRTWKHEKHAKGFDILPKKYRTDPECLVCHTTGFGEPTGYKDASTPQLAGITCETCHGPGSEHVKLAQKLFLTAEVEVTLEAEKKIRDSIELFLEKDTIAAQEAKKKARGSIFRIQPGNACVKCHTTKAHQAHLDYDKE